MNDKLIADLTAAITAVTNDETVLQAAVAAVQAQPAPVTDVNDEVVASVISALEVAGYDVTPATTGVASDPNVPVSVASSDPSTATDTAPVAPSVDTTVDTPTDTTTTPSDVSELDLPAVTDSDSDGDAVSDSSDPTDVSDPSTVVSGDSSTATPSGVSGSTPVSN